MKSYNKTQVDKLWKKCQKRISKEEKKLQKSSTGAYLMNPIHTEDETKTKNKLETKILDINNPLLYACIHVKNGMYKEQKHVLRFKVKYGVDPDIYIYPYNSPLVSFMTNVWHPNISKEGTICLDVLKDQWSPSFGFEAIINSVLILLESPDPSSPQNNEAGKMYKENLDQFKKKVASFYQQSNKEWINLVNTKK